MKNPSSEVLILGAGFAGLSTAIFLKRLGLAVRIFEANAHPNHAGGGLVLSPNGMRVLRKIKLAQAFIEAGNVMNKTSFFNKSEDLIVEKNFAKQTLYGEPSIYIRREEAHNILTQAAQDERIEIEYSKKLVSVQQHQDHLIALFEDGSSHSGEVLIGADGAGSFVRNYVLNNYESPLIYQKLIYAGGFINDPSFISERCLPIDNQRAIIGDKGVFAYENIHNSALPPSLYWGTFFGSKKRLTRKEISDFSLEEKKTLLKNAHSSYPEIVTRLINKSEDIILASISDTKELPTWSKQRVLLIGDAAHAVSPIIGLGVNMSLEDAQMLSELCVVHNMNFSLIFKDFEQLRKPRVTKIINSARRSSKLSQINLGFLNYFRNFFFSLLIKLANRDKENWIYSYSVEKEILNLRNNTK
jgi:2-polyprenyl-6-methoxyphenol hydroxylase-like FAD-dependent oxidoreductase